jgi:hypothetical protein
MLEPVEILTPFPNSTQPKPIKVEFELSNTPTMKMIKQGIVFYT